VSGDETLSGIERLAEQADELRQRLEQVDDVDEAIALLSELLESIKQAEAQLAQALREAESDARG
jgi:energy-converting hydrogenase A subunit M